MRALLYGLAAVMMVGATVFFWASLATATTVPFEGGQVANLQLMHNQTVALIIAAVLFVCSALFLAGGAVVQAIERDREQG